jgi:endonuclease YncB( thermonuclease family)
MRHGRVTNNYVVAFAGAAWLASALCLPARPTFRNLRPAPVAAVIDGETLQLTDGKTVRLIGAKAPMPPLGWHGEDPWPLVDKAKDAPRLRQRGGAQIQRTPHRPPRICARPGLCGQRERGFGSSRR